MKKLIFYYAFSFLFISGILIKGSKKPESEQIPLEGKLTVLVLSPVVFPMMMGMWCDDIYESITEKK